MVPVSLKKRISLNTTYIWLSGLADESLCVQHRTARPSLPAGLLDEHDDVSLLMARFHIPVSLGDLC
jgi:hypothetical protein